MKYRKKRSLVSRVLEEVTVLDFSVLLPGPYCTMMLAELGEAEAADRVEQAIIKALTSGKIKSLSAGRMGLSTSEVGDLVASYV